MAIRFLIAIIVIVLLDVFVSTIAHAQAPAAGGATAATAAAATAEKQDADFGARLDRLQGTQDCISNAKTREAVDQCRKSLKLERKLKATAH